MDAIILNEQQIEVLRSFIIKRGIKEADVVNEILDHFACKTEEILTINPAIDFEKAMQKAHQSFGKCGFRPIIAQYEKHLEKIAWQDFKVSVKEVLVSPGILFSIAATLLFYKSVSIIPEDLKIHWLFSVKYWALLFCLLSFAVVRFILIKKYFGKFPIKTDQLFLWQQKSLSRSSNVSFSLFLSLMIMPTGNKEISNLQLLYCSITILLNMISLLAEYKLLAKMHKRFSLASKTA